MISVSVGPVKLTLSWTSTA